MKKNIILILSAIVLGLFITSCSKGDKGAVGPAGPVGITGPSGPQGIIGAAGPIGATGPQGLPGAPGVAGTPTVTYSGWTTLTNWAAGGAVSARSYAFTPAPGITSSVISNGIVLAYFRNFPSLTASLNNGGFLVVIPNQVVSLPYSEVDSRTYGAPINGTVTTISEWTYFLAEPGFITYTHKSAATGIAINYSAANLNFVAIQARYVIIPGSIAGGRITSGPAAGYSVDQVKAMNYDQVRNMFNLPAEGTNIK